MKVPIKVFCAECSAEEPKVILIYTREYYCGAACHAEGYLKYNRMMRFLSTEVEHG